MFNIEMQTASEAGLRQRLTYYAATLYADQIHGMATIVKTLPA